MFVTSSWLAFFSTTVVRLDMLDVLLSAVCLMLLTVLLKAVTVLLSAFLESVSDILVIVELFSSTVCLISLNVLVSTLLPMSVSRVVVRVLRLDNSLSVSVFHELISTSNFLMPVISPLMLIMSCNALVTSLSLISTHSYAGACSVPVLANLYEYPSALEAGLTT